MTEKAPRQPQRSVPAKRQKSALYDVQREAATLVKPANQPISPSEVLQLQRQYGNQAVLNMLQRTKAATPMPITQTAQRTMQRAVDEEGVPTELDPVKDATTISGLKTQYLKFQQNLISFWDSYGLEHPKDKPELFQRVWGHYLEGLKGGSQSQSGLASVKDVNSDSNRTSKIEAPDYKSVLGVKSMPHPDAKPRTEEEQALADEMGVMRMQMADDAIVALQNLVDAFSTEFDKAIAKVRENAEKENSKIPWYNFWAKRKVPNYIFWSGGKANKFVEEHHKPEDSIQLEMTMGKMAWLDGLGRNWQTQAPNAITAYTGENFQIWTALSQRYALKAAAEAQKGHKWNFIGYMSDIAVDEQSVYNTIERPTIVDNLGVDLDITWKLVDKDAKTDKLYVALESKDRNEIIEELKRRTSAPATK